MPRGGYAASMEPSRVSPGADSRVHVELPAVPEAPAAARRALSELPLGPLRDDALLLASELVTNAVHRAPEGGGTVEVEAEAGAGGVRVEVRDSGRRFEPGPEPDYAMRIVAGAAHRWGVESDDATRAWFELDAPS